MEENDDMSWLHACIPSQHEDGYPLLMSFNGENRDGTRGSELIVEFIGLTSGVVVRGDNQWNVGDIENHWIEHTNREIWSPVMKCVNVDGNVDYVTAI